MTLHFAISLYWPLMYIENKDSPLTQVKQRLGALRIRAVVDHNSFSTAPATVLPVQVLPLTD